MFTTIYSVYKGFPGGSVVKNLPANARDTKTLSLLPKYPLEKEMETHSMMLGKIPRGAWQAIVQWVTEGWT